MDRMCPPSRYDSAEYGTICRVKKDDGGYDVYIQVSDDQSNPCWVTFGDFLHRVFADKLSDQSFITECIHKYNS